MKHPAGRDGHSDCVSSRLLNPPTCPPPAPGLRALHSQILSGASSPAKLCPPLFSSRSLVPAPALSELAALALFSARPFSRSCDYDRAHHLQSCRSNRRRPTTMTARSPTAPAQPSSTPATSTVCHLSPKMTESHQLYTTPSSLPACPWCACCIDLMKPDNDSVPNLPEIFPTPVTGIASANV